MTFASKPEAKAKLFFFPSKELEMIELRAFAPKFMPFFIKKFGRRKFFLARDIILWEKLISSEGIL